MPKVTFIRDSGWADRIRKYKIVVDGQVIAKVGDGETVEVDVESGERKVWIKIDWCRSNYVQMFINPGTSYVANCGSNLRGMRLYLCFIYSLVAWRKYAWLKIDELETS